MRSFVRWFHCRQALLLPSPPPRSDTRSDTRGARVFPPRAHARRPRPGLPGAGLRNMDPRIRMLTLHSIPVPGTLASIYHN